jgi:hypothetical protein
MDRTSFIKITPPGPPTLNLNDGLFTRLSSTRGSAGTIKTRWVIRLGERRQQCGNCIAETMLQIPEWVYDLDNRLDHNRVAVTA